MWIIKYRKMTGILMSDARKLSHYGWLYSNRGKDDEEKTDPCPELARTKNAEEEKRSRKEGKQEKTTRSRGKRDTAYARANPDVYTAFHRGIQSYGQELYSLRIRNVWADFKDHELRSFWKENTYTITSDRKRTKRDLPLITAVLVVAAG